MRPSQSDSTTASAPTDRSLAFLLVMIFLVVAVVGGFPRFILSAASLGGSGKGGTTAMVAPVSGESSAQLASIIQASALLDNRDMSEQAARLLDRLPGSPLVVADGDNIDSTGKFTPFSSMLLVMRLGRQMDETAQRHACANPCSESHRAEALQWTSRCRRLADAILSAPKPSFAALKTAHYLDTIASRREIALYKAWGDQSSALVVTRQNESLRRVWIEQIMPLLADKTKGITNGEWAGAPQNGSTPDEGAVWSARVAQMLNLYQKERFVISAA